VEEKMPMTLEEALKTALDDEYRARATYRAVLDAYGEVRPFSNIVESEERHIQALRRLCERYGVSVPADPWPARISAPQSLEAACQAAVEAERENGGLYRRLMEAAGGRADVEETFRRLLTASQENHLPAFERALGRERQEGTPGGPEGGERPRRRRHRGGRAARP
jgi:rubrerythrin